MRKITREAVAAFFDGYDFNKSNTSVISNKIGTTRMYLHGNLIATIHHMSGEVKITAAGWYSNTTKERLNGIMDYLDLPRIYQKNWEWYIGNPDSDSDDIVFDGDWNIVRQARY